MPNIKEWGFLAADSNMAGAEKYHTDLLYLSLSKKEAFHVIKKLIDFCENGGSDQLFCLPFLGKIRDE